MDVDSSPRTRKRARSLHQHFNSSPPAANITPLSAIKRRKLDIISSSPSTPKALQALKTAIGGVFNFGKKKEVANGNETLETASQVSKDTDGATAVFDEFIDELLAEESQDQGVDGDNYELETHTADHPKQYGNGDTEPQASKPRRKGRKSRGSVNTADERAADDIDELLNGETHHNIIHSNQNLKTKFEEHQKTPYERGNNAEMDSESARKGKRSRSSVTAPDAEAADDELSAATEPPVVSSSRKAGARTGAAETFSKQNLKWHTRPTTTKMASPEVYDGARDASISEEPLSGSAGRPSRERRRPRRYSNEILEEIKLKPMADTTPGKTLDFRDMTKSRKKLEPVNMLTPSQRPELEIKSTSREQQEASSVSTPSKKPPPRSILTPSKSTRERPRKSVTFGVESPRQENPDLGLQDAHGEEIKGTPISTRRKRGRPKNTTNSGLAAAGSPSQRENVAEESSSVERDENRRSLRQKADAVPPQKLKPSKGRETSLEKTSYLEKEDTPSKERRLRSVKHTVNGLSPERPKQRVGRGASTVKTSDPEDKADANSDEITCVICGGGDSEPPNEILLCDNCDLAAHQVCYGVQVIPEGDWLCRDCRPDEDEELMLVDTGTVSEPSIEMEASNIPDIEGFEYHMQVMQKLVLDKLTGQRRLKLYGLDEEYRKVHQVVMQTVLAGEGNSMLVIGARGCGKTTLVESVMSCLSKDHRDNFHVVRLNGFIHTDDKLALREIWRQLGREMEVDDDLTAKTNNYADTLASLLALLSHPSEISEVESNQTTKSVIFILDEFDLFTSHPRQTLLYNLFDIAQARKAPIAVLGLTTKIDVVERLEKRVKSRFSHRSVHLPLPKNLGVYWEICRQGLLADKDEIEDEGFTYGLEGHDEFRLFWESMINDLYNEDEVFRQQLQTQFYRSKSVSAFLTSCILPIANLSPSSLPLTGASFFFTLPTLSPPDSKLHLLQSLAELDLALLIAAARLNIILDTENCNFAMAYDEYCGLTSKHKIQTSSTGVAALGAATKVWGREVAIGAWERLVECELLISAGLGGAGTLGRDGGREVKMYKVDVALDEIPGSVEGLSSIMAKWCREI